MHLILNINLIFLRIYIGQNIEYSMTLKKFYDLNLNNLNIKIMLLYKKMNINTKTNVRTYNKRLHKAMV